MIDENENDANNFISSTTRENRNTKTVGYYRNTNNGRRKKQRLTRRVEGRWDKPDDLRKGKFEANSYHLVAVFTLRSFPFWGAAS